MVNSTQPATATIYRAERIPGPDGMVERGSSAIDEETAVACLQAGEDIVVCGPDRRTNRNKARELVQSASGGFEVEEVHDGRMALWHFHPLGRTPADTHAFYESPPKHARKSR